MTTLLQGARATSRRIRNHVHLRRATRYAHRIADHICRLLEGDGTRIDGQPFIGVYLVEAWHSSHNGAVVAHYVAEGSTCDDALDELVARIVADDGQPAVSLH